MEREPKITDQDIENLFTQPKKEGEPSPEFTRIMAMLENIKPEEITDEELDTISEKIALQEENLEQLASEKRTSKTKLPRELKRGQKLPVEKRLKEMLAQVKRLEAQAKEVEKIRTKG